MQQYLKFGRGVKLQKRRFGQAMTGKSLHQKYHYYQNLYLECN